MSISDQIDQARIGDLRRFVAVVEAGGFTAAARRLGETPKQLSRRIALLEQALETRLFHRTTRRVTTTIEGQHAYTSVRSALEALDVGIETLAEQGISGTVRVMVPSLLASSFMHWLASTLPSHPALAVDLVISDRAVDLVAEGLDLAITAQPGSATTVVLRRLGALSAQLCAAPAYLERCGTPTTIAALAHHECLRFLSTEPQHVWPLVRGTETAKAPIGGRLVCNDSRALLEALHAGLGIGPRSPSPTPDGLIPVLPEWRMAPIDLYAMVAPGRRRLARVRLVLEAADQLVRTLVS